MTLRIGVCSVIQLWSRPLAIIQSRTLLRCVTVRSATPALPADTTHAAKKAVAKIKLTVKELPAYFTAKASKAPGAVPEIKRICRSVTMAQCERIAQRVRTLDSARDVKTYLTEEFTRAFPDLPV